MKGSPARAPSGTSARPARGCDSGRTTTRGSRRSTLQLQVGIAHRWSEKRQVEHPGVQGRDLVGGEHLAAQVELIPGKSSRSHPGQTGKQLIGGVPTKPTATRPRLTGVDPHRLTARLVDGGDDGPRPLDERSPAGSA